MCYGSFVMWFRHYVLRFHHHVMRFYFWQFESTSGVNHYARQSKLFTKFPQKVSLKRFESI